MAFGGPKNDEATPQGREDAPASAPRVMVIEDDVLIALDLAMMVEETGAEVIGPFHTLDAAQKGLGADMPDLAILDYNIGSGTSEALAERLERTGVAVAFLTGHSTEHVTARVGSATVIEKPVSKDRIARLLAAL